MLKLSRVKSKCVESEKAVMELKRILWLAFSGPENVLQYHRREMLRPIRASFSSTNIVGAGPGLSIARILFPAVGRAFVDRNYNCLYSGLFYLSSLYSV